MSTKSVMTGRKCVFETVPITELEGLRIWKERVLCAITEEPPKTVTRTVEITRDDPRFNGPFTMDIRMGAGVSEADLKGYFTNKPVLASTQP